MERGSDDEPSSLAKYSSNAPALFLRMFSCRYLSQKTYRCTSLSRKRCFVLRESHGAEPDWWGTIHCQDDVSTTPLCAVASWISSGSDGKGDNWKIRAGLCRGRSEHTKSRPYGALPELALPNGGVQPQPARLAVLVDDEGVLEAVVDDASARSQRHCSQLMAFMGACSLQDDFQVDGARGITHAWNSRFSPAILYSSGRMLMICSLCAFSATNVQ